MKRRVALDSFDANLIKPHLQDNAGILEGALT